MKVLLGTICLILLAPSLLWAGVVRPKSEISCVANAIAKEMKITLNDEIALPKVNYASEVTLADFQNAVEPQWGMKPDVIVNVYITSLNEIYLIDDEIFYTPKARFIDDSLAHELVHYFQVKYKGTLVPQDFEEYEAVLLQTWYRQKFMEQKEDPCAY